MESEYKEIRFGAIAVKKGFVTPEQVVEAISMQTMENLSDGRHRRIGRILIDKGLITIAQRDEVLTALEA